MQLTKKLEIQRKQKIIEFLNNEPVGTTKPDAIYMQSHPIGEKLDNIKRNSKVGFEVDRLSAFYPLTIFILRYLYEHVT
jgi:uncharacterized protein